ncbi:LysR substrate-binding domain-containing protein [Pusillimonas sp. SM2304]|uniref:LysR family transcriptional regulator n=1 Tax=Pusillimonas sp. SM2304 TaxID=3073241 RepID=UPI002875C22F|nr:LysR substrate-binding domain-containing protein [Pusillimonas sp. SM2304]MDS1139697.1 LysR substrate-binding domain-containing protein [Pusillimonas sp. SM2304]
MSQLKLFEDFIALARARSFVRAAEARHVTHPAFGRRIRALERWAGAPLVDRSQVPVVLTEQGEVLLKTACQVIEQLQRVRSQISLHGGESPDALRIAAGRSLGRTLVADWVARLRKSRPAVLAPATPVDIFTGMMADMSARLAQGKADFLVCYEHPAMSLELHPDNYQYMTLTTDKLVPVCQVTAQGKPRYALEGGHGSLPLIAYSRGLAMGRIVGDRIETMPYPLVPSIRCDSLDAVHGTVSNGLGIAWLPWSMVAADCRQGSLAVLGGRSEQIAFEVRLYRSRSRLSNVAEAVWKAMEKR